MIGSPGKHIFGAPRRFLGAPIVACYRRGGCTPEGIPVVRSVDWWGVGPQNSAEKNALIEKNGQIIWETLSKYPYPAPFEPGDGVHFFLANLKPDLVALANVDYELDPDMVRVWITLYVLSNYEAWTQEIEQFWERLAKRRQKIAMRRAIAVAVGSLVVGIAAPVAFAALFSAVQTAVNTYIDLQKARDAANALAEAAAAFEQSDPEFAKEVKRAEEIMDMIADDAAAKEEEARGVVQDLPAAAVPPSEGGVSPLLIGGGLAATGLVLFALLS